MYSPLNVNEVNTKKGAVSMKVSSMWSEKGRRRRIRWLAAALLAMVIIVSACSGANDDADDTGSGSPADEAPREASESESGSDSSDRATEPTRETAERGGSYSNSNNEVQAGQLTAGEWDDSAAWEGFRNLL
jgi:hypothetical protein